jgi:hypothetical protein
MSASPASVPDDTELIPPKSQKQIRRPQHPSMPFPLIDEEPFFSHLSAVNAVIRILDSHRR